MTKDVGEVGKMKSKPIIIGSGIVILLIIIFLAFNFVENHKPKDLSLNNNFSSDECQSNTDCQIGQWCNYRYKNCVLGARGYTCSIVGDGKCKINCAKNTDCISGVCKKIERCKGDACISYNVCGEEPEARES